MSDPRYIDGAPAGSEGWREVWEEDLEVRPASGPGILGRLIRKIVRRALGPEMRRQRDFNLAALELLRDERTHAEALKTGLHDDFRNDVEALQSAFSRTLGDALSNEDHRLRELIITASKRNDALIAALDQKIESIAVRIRDAVNPVVSTTSPDVLYRRVEDALRGSETHVREDVAPYVDWARDHQPVLDAGCGRGEFLRACRDAGVEAQGVDVNERSIADLKQRGFNVAVAAVPDCFAPIDPAALGSILAMHVVEHLPVDALIALFREAARVLTPGGLLMIETPNAESILVSASDFWRDPTHLAPRHVAALTTLGREHGFEIAEVRAIHEVSEGARIAHQPNDPPALTRVIDAINDRLFAPQDLRLILRKVPR
jgi:SAM-dependent methyltransferase